MTAPWHKVVRDIWRERTRASLVMLAIAVGLTGFLAVLSTYAILQRELDRGYLATNPASAVIVMDRIDEALIAATIARGDVEDADARTVVSGRIQTPDGSWRRLMLFVVRDFDRLRISTVTPEAGAWPPATGEMLIERDAFQVGKTSIGAAATVETKAGGQHVLRVAGRVHDAGQAQARMENMVYAYIAPATLEVLGERPDLDRLYVLASGNRFDEAHVRQVAGDLKTWLEGSGHVVRRVDVPTPGQHPHAVIMGFLLLLMDAFGAFALALSGVIVTNLLLAMLAAERRQIGVMKALGGSRGQIARLYLAEAGVLGLGALMMAVPAGVLAGRALSRYFGVLLNFDLNSLAIPLWVFALAIVIALIVPLVAAAYPVAIATDITVRAALDASVNATTFGVSRLDRWFARMTQGASPLVLGIRNSMRRRTRTALTGATLACAGAFFMSALNVRTSLMTTADRQFGAGTYGADFRYAFDQHMLMIYVFLIIVAAVLASIGGLGLTTATSLNVLERRRELGVLRAVGASPATVATIVVSESLFVAVTAWMIAVVAAWVIAMGIGAVVPRVSLFKNGLSISLSAIGIVGWLGISAAIAIAASVAPAIAAGRHSIREAISYE